jgi:hypothetical protein
MTKRKALLEFLKNWLLQYIISFWKFIWLVHYFVAPLIYEMTEASNESFDSFIHKLADLCWVIDLKKLFQLNGCIFTEQNWFTGWLIDRFVILPIIWFIYWWFIHSFIHSSMSLSYKTSIMSVAGNCIQRDHHRRRCTSYCSSRTSPPTDEHHDNIWKDCHLWTHKMRCWSI